MAGDKQERRENGAARGRHSRRRERSAVDQPYEEFAKKNEDWDRRVRDSIKKLTSRRSSTAV